MKTSIAFPLALLLALPATGLHAAPVPPPLAPPLRLPAPVSRTLPNGLRVVVFPSASVPIVQIQLLVPAGVAEEPDSLPGLATVAARIVRQGSASRTAEQLKADLDAFGATFTTVAQRDYALAACGGRAADFEAVLEIMGDAVLGPRVGPEELQRVLREQIGDLGDRARSEPRLADDRVWGVAFDPHPYGHAERGILESVPDLGLDQVRAFLRDRWRPDRAVLAISGDVTPERAFAAATDAFGRWAGTTSADRARPMKPGPSGLHLLDLSGSPRAEVRVAVRGPGRAAPEQAAWLVATAALEDRLAGTPAVVSLTTLRDASLLVISQGAPADSAAAVVGRLRGALRDVASAPAGAASMQVLRRRVAQSLPLALETIGARLSRWQADDFAGLPDDAVERMIASLASASFDLGPVSRALSAEPLVLVAGPREKLGPLLAPLGAVSEVPITPWRPSFPDSTPGPTAAELRAGRAAVESAVAAHGGARRLTSVKCLANEGQIVIETPAESVNGRFSFIRIEPSRFMQSTQLLNFEERQVLEGDIGWVLSLGDSVTLVDADSLEVLAMRAVFHSDLVHLLRAAQSGDSRAALRAQEDLDGTVCDLVDFTGYAGQRYRLAIDRSSRRVVAVDTGYGPDGRWHERRRLSDWKTVQGLVLPALEERYLEGTRVGHFRSELLLVDPKLGEEMFRKPRVVAGKLIPQR